MRLIRWLQQRSTSRITETRADAALSQLEDANRLLKRVRATRERQTGNLVADMVRGAYVSPRKRGAQ